MDDAEVPPSCPRPHCNHVMQQSTLAAARLSCKLLQTHKPAEQWVTVHSHMLQDPASHAVQEALANKAPDMAQPQAGYIVKEETIVPHTLARRQKQRTLKGDALAAIQLQDPAGHVVWEEAAVPQTLTRRQKWRTLRGDALAGIQEPAGHVVREAAIVPQTLTRRQKWRTLEGDALAAIQLQDPAGHVVQEEAVVRDGHHGPPERRQRALQPRHAAGVQVVGWLIQQQDVRLL